MACDHYQFYYHSCHPVGASGGSAAVHRLCPQANLYSNNPHCYRTERAYADLASYSPSSPLNGLRTTRIILVSDTHLAETTLGTLPPCDILIHAGDILFCSYRHLSCHSLRMLKRFGDWFSSQPAKTRILVAGNHDSLLESMTASERKELFPNTLYLCNESVEAEGITIWGSPLSHGRSYNRAYQSQDFSESTLAAARKAQGKVDVLVTHGPCKDVRQIIQPRMMHMFGHVHAHHGCYVVGSEENGLVVAGAPIMDTSYNPSHNPVVVDFLFCSSSFACSSFKVEVPRVIALPRQPHQVSCVVC